MKLLEKTTYKDVRVKYYWKTRGKKTEVRAQLFDDSGNKLEDCSASYTLQASDTYEDACIAARYQAEKKFEKKFLRNKVNEADSKSGCFFSNCWQEIPEFDRINLAPDSKNSENSKRDTITYFANNVLPLLDARGPCITPDQCGEVCREMYRKMLENKKYMYCFVPLENTQSIQKFISIAKTFLTESDSVKSVLGGLPKKSYVDALMNSIQSRILEEDRLRTLLEVALSREANLNKVLCESIWGKIKQNGALIDRLRKLKSGENRAIAENDIIFSLREFSGNEAQTKVQTNAHIRDANDILKKMSIRSEKVMPAITLQQFIVVTPPQIEACKELPWSVRVRFSAITMYLADTCACAVGGIVMMTSAPRVTEVLAIQFGDILDYGDWGMCVINYTVDGDIRRDDGKNIYFRRPIFFPKFAMDAIHKRKQYLLREGYREEQIAEAYIVNRDNDLHVPEKSHRFSETIKNMLRIAGCNNEYWESVRYAMIAQPDYDYFHRPETFEIAYGLRRDSTTMMCNVALMNPYKIDAIQGHRLPNHVENWQDRIRRVDEWKVIIDEMERIVYDPDHSNHPMFKVRNVMEVKKEGESTGKPATFYHGSAITTDKLVRVRLKVKTVGNADIRVNAPKDSKFIYSLESIANTAGPSRWLGVLHTKEEYDHVKAQAIKDYIKLYEERER